MVYDGTIASLNNNQQAIEKKIRKFQLDTAPETLEKVTEIIGQGIDESLHILEQAKEQSQEQSKDVVDKLESNVQDLENLSKEISSSKDRQTVKEFRNEAERMWRRTILMLTPFAPDVEATIMWALEKGEDEELITLQQLQKKSGYNDSQEVLPLINLAAQKIKERILAKVEFIYKVFCHKNDLDDFTGKIIFESYPAFTIISASEETISELKTLFPVEKLELPKEPKPNPGESNMTGIRAQVIRFNAPVLEHWKQRIKDLDPKIKILQPLSRFEIVISIPHEEILTQIKNLEKVSQIEPYEPTIDVQLDYLESLKEELTEKAISKAKLRAERKAQNSQDQNIYLPGIFIASFFTKEDCERALQNLKSKGILISDRPDDTELVLDLVSNSDVIKALKMVTQQKGLRTLEEQTINALFNDVACSWERIRKWSKSQGIGTFFFHKRYGT